MKELLKEIIFRLKRKIKFLSSYYHSTVFGYLNKGRYKKVNTFCIFIGYPRSGHTIIASLLNAHPNIMIGIEEGILLQLNLLKCSKNQIFHSIIKNAISFSNKRQNIWTGYSYEVKNSWQGNYKELYVIGDKHGGENSKLISKNPHLLSKLEKVIRLRPKIIHVMRNPFDIITTHTIRMISIESKNKPTELNLLSKIQEFFEEVEVLNRLKKEGNYDILDVHHEDFIKSPKETLIGILAFLSIEADEEYLSKCQSILYQTPNRSRLNIEWPEKLIEYVENKITEYSFLRNYKYDD